MTKWKEYKLGELVAINERSIGRNFEFKAIEYIDTSSVTENKFDTPTYTTISEAPSRAKRLIANGDTIISTVRPIQKHYGFIKEAKGNQVVSTGFAVVTPKRIEPRFLYYFLTQAEITEFLNTIAEGGTTTFPAFKADELKDLPINLPDYDTQTAIAEILSSLDDKIELNNKINQELENLAQTLFKQWFIDFEFPANLMDSTLSGAEGYKSSGGEMVESELGEIPKGWEVRSLDDIASEITRGFTTKYIEKSNLINLNQKVNRGVFLDKSNFKYYPEDTTVPVNKFAKQRDILINSLGQGTLGRIHFYKECTTNVVVDQHITILRGNEYYYLPEILYLMLTYSSNQERLEEMVTGSTGMLMLNISKIREFKVIVPSIKLQQSLNENVVSYFENINNNILENQELTNLRDTLLPKLISGELEINF